MGYRVLASVTAAAMLGAFVVSVSAQTAKPKAVAKTEWGTPNLRGVWDFRTITPLERPDGLSNKEFLSEEEASELEQQVVERNKLQDARPAEATKPGGNVDVRADGTPGFYNSFWLDGGTKAVGTRRTSLVVDPPDGKVPPLTEAARKRAEARRRI